MNRTLPATGRRYAGLSAAVFIAILANGAHGTTAEQTVTLSVNDVVGCYELYSIEWTPSLSTLPESQRRLYTPPRLFSLTAIPIRDSQDRRILSRYPDDRQRLAHGVWRLTDEHELTAMFVHNGFEWLYVVVNQRSSDGRLSGRAFALTDTGPPRPHREGSVAFGRVACWD